MKTHIFAINILITLLAVLVAGCTSKTPVSTEPPQTTKTTGVELDSAHTAALRSGETLRAYPINRYVDPRDPDLMHEAHTLYRKETPSAWNLSPAPAASAIAANQKLAAQSQLVAALIEQNRTLIAELSRLTGEIALMREHTKNETKQP